MKKTGMIIMIIVAVIIRYNGVVIYECYFHGGLIE